MDIFVGSRTRKTRLGFAPDDETILDYARQALERPSESYWNDDTLWITHTLLFAYAPGSDDLVGESNYQCILEDLSTAYAKSPDAITAGGFGHWTYSHYDAVRVRVTYANGEIHPAFADAVAIALALQDYPLYSEDDYSEREWKAWESAIEEAARYALEDESDGDEIRSDVLEYLHSDRAELVGYHDVGYVPDETVTDAIAYAREIRSRAENVGLIRPNDSGVPIF